MKKIAREDPNAGCAVVSNSSVNGTRMFSDTGATAYSVTKACLLAFNRQMALELSKDHIREVGSSIYDYLHNSNNSLRMTPFYPLTSFLD